jgi:hypothetical protein
MSGSIRRALRCPHKAYFGLSMHAWRLNPLFLHRDWRWTNHGLVRVYARQRGRGKRFCAYASARACPRKRPATAGAIGRGAGAAGVWSRRRLLARARAITQSSWKPEGAL